MEKETKKTNGIGNAVDNTAGQEEEAVRSNHDNSATMRKLKSKLRFWIHVVVLIAIFIAGINVGYNNRYKWTIGKPLKFMTQKEDLKVEQFLEDPIDSRDFAWDSEDIPGFISSDFKKATLRDYDGVEYSFGENKIHVEEEFFSDKLEIIVNSDLGWTMSNFSIYSSGENIVIYGYWNDEFRRITLGKTEESVQKEVLTLHPGVAFSANSKYISEEAKKDYIFVISQDMRTVSAYKDNAIVGEEVVLSDEILGFYDGIMILAKSNDYTDKLYMPYVVENNGKEEFVCLEIASVTTEEVENVSNSEYIDTFQAYTTNYSARMGYICCYIFENEDGTIRMIVPNDIQKYAEYRRGTGALNVEDDLGWHWVTIDE